MKKAILVLAVLSTICAFGFSENFWFFKSGSRDLDGKVFGRVSVINKTGEDIEVAGEVLENNGKGLYFEESIKIACKIGEQNSFDAVYSIDGKHLQIIICPRGSYKLDSKTRILPPIRLAHRNPPPAKPGKRYEHGPAPKRMDPRHAPRNPQHNEPNFQKRDNVQHREKMQNHNHVQERGQMQNREKNQNGNRAQNRDRVQDREKIQNNNRVPGRNGARPYADSSNSNQAAPKNDSRKQRPENPRRPVRPFEKNFD